MYFDELSVGQRFEIAPFFVTKEEICEFASKYDPLSIHLDEDFAANSIYGGLIAPGLFTLCAIWGEWGRLKIVDKEVIGGLCIDYLNWHFPVRPGDSLSAVMEVAQLIPSSKGGKGVLVVKVTAINQNKETVLTAQIRGLIMSSDNTNNRVNK